MVIGSLFFKIMDTQPAFDTVTEALQWLTQEGFTENFNLDENFI